MVIYLPSKENILFFLPAKRADIPCAILKGKEIAWDEVIQGN
jgi:hypothetical protein